MLLQLVQTLRYESNGENSELATLLIDRAKNNFDIANNLNWYLKVEMSDPKYGQLFERCLKRVTNELSKAKPEFIESLEGQQKLIDHLVNISKKLSLLKNRKAKITEFENILKKDNPYNWTRNIISSTHTLIELFSHPIALPLIPSKKIIGFIPSKAYVFKSAKTPMLVPFKLSNGEPFMALFKCGDDLRQDQLILQLINLMNKVLIKNGLDLKLTPYKVLATSVDHGLVQCVLPSDSISNIMSIQAYLKRHNPDPESYEQACETFVRSCGKYLNVALIFMKLGIV
jgi:phosphatidylinositol 3-kinase